MRPKRKIAAEDDIDGPNANENIAPALIEETKKGLFVRVRVQPGASQNSIDGIRDGALKVRIAAPPVEGAANKALVEYLAKALKIKKSSIEITSGVNSRDKRLRLSDIVAVNLKTQLERLLTT